MYDVVIAGAGPVGLFLACELRLAKLSVLVMEALADPHLPQKKLPFGMRGLWGPSVEAFYRRGLLDQIAAQPASMGQATIHSTSATKGPGGHFAGIQFDRANIDPTRWTYRLEGPSAIQLGSSMEHIESVLSAHAFAAGVEIHRGRGVESFEETEDKVVINQRIEARWLVGCDGGRSTVRKQGGFQFVGTEPELTGYSVEVDLQGVLPMGRHPTPTGMFTQWRPGVFGLVDFDGGKFHRAELTVEHIEGVLRRVSGVDVTVTAVRTASTWTDRSMQATTYRKGRVLLAGDSAHVHSPLGGQGLNLGFGDAMNLGWKLAATVRGEAPAGLLDTYTAERHPVGERVLEWTRAQVALMRPSSSALHAVVRDLVGTRDGATYFAERIWGVNTKYDLGEEHLLVGRTCPDFELADGTRACTLLRDGTGMLLDFDRVLPALEGRRGFKRVALDAKDRLGLSAVLVRPDGVVAWASDATPTSDDVLRAAATWF
ncbi:MAG TPA: FAD-dependent monooxygenase [Kofleriaceae bacterium]|jgi:2-polyprenyl-6-methoxyphenol hydroxylase-like FAD-dependent oxidoreductase